MTEMPDFPNFFSSLHAALSPAQAAGLYEALGWRVRKCSWTDYEVFGPWAEFVIEAESPNLMHGLVADILDHADELLAPLRRVSISFTAEC
jgi:hypothetical protein